MTRDYTNSLEARATQERRRALRNGQPEDTLAHRARSIAFWKECSKTNRHYLPFNGAWWHPFVTQTWGRRLLMPRLRAMLDARRRAQAEAFRAELRAQSLAWRQKKALLADAKRQAKAGQAPLFEVLP